MFGNLVETEPAARRDHPGDRNAVARLVTSVLSAMIIWRETHWQTGTWTAPHSCAARRCSAFCDGLGFEPDSVSRAIACHFVGLGCNDDVAFINLASLRFQGG